MKRPIQLITNAITSDMVRKEEFQGEMHYMIKSATMPDDIVMNGILYPSEEIELSYKGLERVHAPVGHPVDDDGMFISASDPFAIRNYYIGAQVVNVERKNGKVYHDTAINIAAAKQSERGKRVLDRVEALMNGDNVKPIHTSTGVYLKKNELDTPMSNQYGEYSAIASKLYFDHNAILLDEVGAATPDQGTGMAVNSVDQTVFVHNAEGDVVAVSGDDMFSDMYELSRSIREAIKIKHASGNDEYVYINELHDSYVIAEIAKDGVDESYKIPYMIDGENIVIGELQKVKRNIVYTAVNSLATFIKNMAFASDNHAAYNGNVDDKTNEEITMTPEELKAALAEQATALQANFETSLASAVKPLQDELAVLKANAQSAEKAEKEVLIAKSGLDASIAGEMSVNALKAVVSRLESVDAGEFGERTGVEMTGNSKDAEFSNELPEG